MLSTVVVLSFLLSGYCQKETTEQQQTKMTGGELRQMFQTVEVVELYRAQYEAAKFLELAYMGVIDHPELAKAVRMTAVAARTQHVMSVGLMKSFTATSAHIVKTMIPMLLNAVNLKNKKLVFACFKKLISLATRMKTEAEKRRQSYMELEQSINKDIADVHERNIHVVKEKERLDVEQKRQQDLAKEATRAAKEYEAEKAKMEEMLADLKKKVDLWTNRSGDKTFLDAAAGPPLSVTGLGGVAGKIIDEGINIVSTLFGGNKRHDRFKEVMKMISKNQAAVEKVSGQKWDVLKKAQEKREEALTRLADIKKMNLEYESLGDVASLQEAQLRLGDADKQFQRIIEFWQNMEITLQHLLQDTEAGDVYIDQIEDPQYAELFKVSITQAEDDWKFFGHLCHDYVLTSEGDTQVSIHGLYSFLDGRVHADSTADRKSKMMAIENEITDSLNADPSEPMPKKDEL